MHLSEDPKEATRFGFYSQLDGTTLQVSPRVVPSLGRHENSYLELARQGDAVLFRYQLVHWGCRNAGLNPRLYLVIPAEVDEKLYTIDSSINVWLGDSYNTKKRRMMFIKSFKT